MTRVRNNLKRLLNNAVSEVLMLVVVCCLVTETVSVQLNNEWTTLSIAANVACGAVMLVWLVWATYMLCSGREIKEMRPASRRVVECCSAVLFVYWFVAAGYPRFAWPWMIVVAWFVCSAATSWVISRRKQ